MATRKQAVPVDEKFQNVDLDIFEVLAALDKKDYGFYDRLTPEQQKKFVPFVIIQWMSAIKGQSALQGYYVMSTDSNVNKYLFNENVMKHPKLQWLMLCAASPGIGKQFHQWIPNIRANVSKLKEAATTKEVRDYYAKIYPKADSDSIKEIAEVFVQDQNRKMHLSTIFPNLKLADIETLNQIITDADIKEYERDSGN